MDEGGGVGAPHCTGGVGEDHVKIALNAKGGRIGAEGNCTAKPEQFICFVFLSLFTLLNTCTRYKMLYLS